MKKFFFLTVVLLLCGGLFAQEMIVQHNAKGAYLSHLVAPKENFYSLGRLYNIPPKDIAAFNGLQMEHGLNIGQSINIPLTSQNFSQGSATSHPIFYVVGQKEGLYRVSVNNNKVLMANLRKWNDLKSDVIAPGQKLVVGYLVSNDMSTARQTAPVETEKQAVPKAAEEKAVVKREEERPLPKKEEEKPVVTAEATKPEPVQKKESPVTTERKPEPVKVTTAAVNDGNGGFFKTSFDAQVKAQPLRKDEMATAGIFKTASGWQDAKYYALIDGVEPGTIIRIVNPNNNKAVYAKVLDKMTGIRQNEGYNVRISNAAATALDISDTDKFFVRVNY